MVAGVVWEWARGSRVRLLACAATPVDADAECAPLSNLSEEMALVGCCTRPCGLGSRSDRAVASGLIDAAFAVLMCFSTAVVNGCCKPMLLLSFRSRFARAVAEDAPAPCCASLAGPSAREWHRPASAVTQDGVRTRCIRERRLVAADRWSATCAQPRSSQQPSTCAPAYQPWLSPPQSTGAFAAWFDRLDNWKWGVEL